MAIYVLSGYLRLIAVNFYVKIITRYTSVGGRGKGKRGKGKVGRVKKFHTIQSLVFATQPIVLILSLSLCQ
jgi:hypothetical protein